MPQLILVVALGAGAYFGYRWLKKQLNDAAIATAREMAERTAAKKTARRSDTAREVGDLVWDEKAGVYRSPD